MLINRMKPSSSRREFFQTVTGGFMGGALLSLLERETLAAPLQPHFAPKAKSVIHLFMNGAEPDGFVRPQAGTGPAARAVVF